MAFILDTNIFLQAKNKDYPFTYFPGFWEWLDSGFKTGQFLLLSSVYKEVSGGDDEVSNWIKSRKQYVIKEEKAKNYIINHKKIVNFPLSVKITFATLSVLHGVVKHAIFAGVYR